MSGELHDFGENLLRYNLKGKKFIVFDLEVVEGLNLFYSRPHQIAWQEWHGDKLVSESNYYLKWETPFNISDYAAKLVRFDQKIIDKQGRDPKEIFEIFSKYLYDESYFISGANILNYDVMIAYNSMKKLGLRHDYSYLSRCYDVQSLFKCWKLNRKIDNKNLLQFQLNGSNYLKKGFKSNVGFMAKEFGIEIDEYLAHEALYDVKIESAILFELIKRIEIE